jgi:hypothetical protein
LILEAIAGFIIFWVVVIAVALLISAGGGPWGRYLGKLVRDGQYATPLGDFPPYEDPEFQKPPNENELL